ncbi:hypothetical protein C2857_002289 [Epichloe festucae Fl1]|uniref:Serine-threonine protein kinase 19 n=1 Tax=Epichloe festucae (strain Fl1) TaxID=877507 RepID=A0A7S9KRR2_EPIFF|nr:hypothetical protein C2857_002289 [Epichloe festucae Fl1]
MPQSLRSILGNPRINKPKARSAPPTPQTPQGSPRKTSSRRRSKPRDEDILFPDLFTDLGSLSVLEDDESLGLRDVVQAMRYIRSHMFTAVPETGLTSTRTAEMLNYRASVPRLVTTGHVNAVLKGTPPSRVEREVAELVGKGILRKVRVERRGAAGEALIEMDDLERLLRTGVSDGTATAFLDHLRRDATAQTIHVGPGDCTNYSRVRGEGGPLAPGQVDELVRAGFLTSCSTAVPGNTLHVRPEDRTTLTSIEHVSRFASGTVSAVGGQNAIHLAGGGGGGGGGAANGQRQRRDAEVSSFRIALPGHGRYLKLADGAVDWVREALGRTTWGEGPESWLRERFEGNGLYGTRWKDFWGVEWEWVLGHAAGLGVVEVFDTGSVGKGVRATGA